MCGCPCLGPARALCATSANLNDSDLIQLYNSPDNTPLYYDALTGHNTPNIPLKLLTGPDGKKQFLQPGANVDKPTTGNASASDRDHHWQSSL